MKAGLAMILVLAAMPACTPEADDGEPLDLPGKCAGADALAPFESDVMGAYAGDSRPDTLAGCAELGLSCPADRLLTRQQAICRALALGLPAGVRQSRARLFVDYQLERAVWSVYSTEHRTEPTVDPETGFASGLRQDGRVQVLDAFTGEGLGVHEWWQDGDVIGEAG